MSPPTPPPDEEELRPGRLQPICCTVDVTAEFKDHFLETTTNETGEHFFVFVDDLNTQYTDEAVHGENLNVINGPFRSKTPQQCHTLLRHLQQQNASELDWSCFVILDARSLEDDTVLIVCDGNWDGVLETVRSSFDVVSSTLGLLLIGDLSFEDCTGEARVARDGVWRFRHADAFPCQGGWGWVREGWEWDFEGGRWVEVGVEERAEGVRRLELEDG